MPLFNIDVVTTVTLEAKDKEEAEAAALDWEIFINADVQVMEVIPDSAIEINEDGEPIE